MKRKQLYIITVECIVILALLACYFFVFSEMSNNNETYKTIKTDKEIETAFAHKQNISEDRELHNIEAEISILNNIINIKSEILLKNSVEFAQLYIPSQQNTKTTVKNIVSNNGFKNITSDGNNLKVEFEGKQDSIYIEYEIELYNNFTPLSYTGDTILLTNFLITPAVYKNGQAVLIYESQFGDPYIYDMNNYYITLKSDKDAEVFAPGKKNEEIINNNKITTFENKNVRDFPITILKNAKIEIEKYGNTNIYFINSNNTRDYVLEAMEFATNKIGEYSYKELFIIKAPISQRGMEFSNMIFVSDTCFNDKEILRSVTIHEVFHQWFYGIIGSNQLEQPFFDEGMVNFLTFQITDGSFNKYYNQSLFSTQLKDYSSKEQYYRLVYNDSTSYFNELYEKLGDKFYTLLQKIYIDKKFSIIYFEEFLNYLKDY